MKKKDIKRSTVIIMCFCVAAFMAIVILRPASIPVGADNRAEKPGIAWEDTLTNSSSDFEPLYPMEKDVERFMSKWDIKGISMAVMRNDSLLFAKGFGWADKEKGERMEATTVSRIASASKLVTAVAVAKLVEDGKLDYDMKVFGPSGILNDPEFAESADKRVEEITVGHLLRHQGGFTLGAGDPMFNTAELIKAKRLNHVPAGNELVRIVLGRRLGFTPGSGHRYSNFGYYLLSLVIERVAGRSYWEYVASEIFEPAGCGGFLPATNYYEEKNVGETKYYSPDQEPVEEFNNSGRMVDRCYGGANIRGLLGAGGWVASAADLARFVAAIDGHPGKADILSGETVAAMTACDDEADGCFGWTDSDFTGRWTRSGTLSSAHTLVSRFPDNECWVIITNTGVWTGYHFSRELQRLIDRLRRDYSARFPARDLFGS